MKKFELIIPVDYAETRETLEAFASFARRSKIEDVYLVDDGGSTIARLRRQDTVTKLSCTTRQQADAQPESYETIVLDFRACLLLLKAFGFREAERLKLTRDAWRKDRFWFFLDRVDGQGDFLVVEAEVGPADAAVLKKTALKLLSAMGIPFDRRLKRATIDTRTAAPYTEPVLNSA